MGSIGHWKLPQKRGFVGPAVARACTHAEIEGQKLLDYSWQRPGLDLGGNRVRGRERGNNLLNFPST